MKVKRIEDVFTENLPDRIQGREETKFKPMGKSIYINKEWKPMKKFEKQVLNYLFKNKGPLGIKEVYEINRYLVDGAIILEDERLTLLEMKYALSWYTNNVARAEIQRFMMEKLYENFDNHQKPVRAIVVFEHFSRDWGEIRISPSHNFSSKLSDGWFRFYEDETPLRKIAEMLPIDNVQFKDNELIFERWWLEDE